MKTSEAIRAGIKLTKGQARYVYYMEKPDTCCALGAAIIGFHCDQASDEERKKQITEVIGFHCDQASDAERKKEVTNDFSDDSHGNEACKMIIGSLHRYYEVYGTTIAEDNDEQGLSREQIADRLEKIGE